MTEQYSRLLFGRLLLCTLFLLLSFDGFAQDLEPRRWSHLPVGLNIAGVGSGFTDGDIFFDPVARIRLGLELASAWGLTDRSFGTRGRTPLEANGTLRVALSEATFIRCSAGFGLARGVGNPRARATLTLGWRTGQTL